MIILFAKQSFSYARLKKISCIAGLGLPRNTRSLYFLCVYVYVCVCVCVWYL